MQWSHAGWWVTSCDCQLTELNHIVFLSLCCPLSKEKVWVASGCDTELMWLCCPLLLNFAAECQVEPAATPTMVLSLQKTYLVHLLLCALDRCWG